MEKALLGYDVDFSNYEETERFYLEAVSLQNEDPKTARRYFESIVEKADSQKLKSGSLVSIARQELNDFVMEWMSKNKRRYKTYSSVKTLLEQARGFNPENTLIDALFVELYFINKDFASACAHLDSILTPAGINAVDSNLVYTLKFLNLSPESRRREYMSEEARDFYDSFMYNDLLTPSEGNITSIANIFLEANSRDQMLYYMKTLQFARRRGGDDTPILFTSG